MKTYRLTSSTLRGETIHAVEEYYPEEEEWGIVRVFTSKTRAKEYLQTLEQQNK